MSARVSSSTRAATSKIISPMPARSRPRNSSRSATRFDGSATTVGLRSRSPSRATSCRRTPYTAYTVRAMLCSCDSITSTPEACSPPEGPNASSRLSTASWSGGAGKTSVATAMSRLTLVTVWPITGATSSQTASECVPSSAFASRRTRSTSASCRVASLAAWNSLPTRGRSPSSKRSATTLSRRVMGSASPSSAAELCGTFAIYCLGSTRRGDEWVPCGRRFPHNGAEKAGPERIACLVPEPGRDDLWRREGLHEGRHFGRLGGAPGARCRARGGDGHGRHRQWLFRGAQRDPARAMAEGPATTSYLVHEGPLPHAGDHRADASQRPGAQPQEHPVELRAIAAAPADGLHRSVPGAHAGRERPHRGDDGRLRPAGPRRQGPLRGVLELRRLPRRRGALGGRPDGNGAVRVDADP